MKMADPSRHCIEIVIRRERVFWMGLCPTSDNRSRVWRRLASLAYPFRELVSVGLLPEKGRPALASVLNGVLLCSQFASGLVVLG